MHPQNVDKLIRLQKTKEEMISLIHYFETTETTPVYITIQVKKLIYLDFISSLQKQIDRLDKEMRRL